jgi:hypothetical protein
MHQHLLVALEVAEKVADVLLKTVDAPDFAQVLALSPAIETRELASAPGPATVPQAPLGAIQTTNRLIGKICIAGVYDCRLNRKAIFSRGMIPNINPNPRGRTQRKRGRKPVVVPAIFEERFRTIVRVFAWETSFAGYFFALIASFRCTMHSRLLRIQ